uniref:Transmembrane protein n=1 Tax=Globisporangium ultimum (strain ATCC 200006 / CBS 805.95 / DAOM BR144) TaxID=431595 RepID=K3XB47_GLOUD
MWKRARVVQLLVQGFPHQVSPDNASQATNVRLLLCGLGFMLSCACGVIGIVLSTGHLAPCASEVDVAHGQQLQFTLTIVVASAWLLVTLVLLAIGVSVSIQAIVPGQETSPALVCLRCSCCSLLLKRLVLFAPVVVLSIDNFASWRASHTFTAQHADCTLSFPPTFFGGTSMLFFVMALAQLLSYAIIRASPPHGRDPATTASPVDSHAPAALPPRVRTTRQHKRLVLLGLLAFSISSIAWATMGWIWIVRNHAVSSQTCDEPQSMRDAMNVSIVLLFLIGWVVFTLAVCCRLEDIILAPIGLPTIDPDTLSPRLTRTSVISQPTASPANQQLRKASFTSDVV